MPLKVKNAELRMLIRGNGNDNCQQVFCRKSPNFAQNCILAHVPPNGKTIKYYKIALVLTHFMFIEEYSISDKYYIFK